MSIHNQHTIMCVGFLLQANQVDAAPATESASGKLAVQTLAQVPLKESGAVVPKNQTIDGVSALAVIVIASFAIDRIVTGLLFVLSFSSHWTRWFPVPELIPEKEEVQIEPKVVLTSEEKPKVARPSARVQRVLAQRRQKLAYYAFAFILGAVVLGLIGKVTLFRALGFDEAPFLLDCVMTGLILVAGADRIAGLLKLPGAPEAEKPAPRPIEITGKLVLEGEGAAKLAAATTADNEPVRI